MKVTSPVVPEVDWSSAPEVDGPQAGRRFARWSSKTRGQIRHVGVVIHYLMKFTNVAAYFFNHQCQTSVSGCHSDDDFCIGQEERLFIEAEPKLCTIRSATINFTLKHECKLPCSGACPSGCPPCCRDRRRESPKSPNRR